MSSDRYIGSNDCVPEAWVLHSTECLLETWAPELQCHGGLGGSAWSLFSDRIRSASNEQDVHRQTICRPTPSHASRGILGGKVAVSYGRSSDGHLPPTSFGGDGNNFGGEGNSDFGGERNNDFGNWRRGL